MLRYGALRRLRLLPSRHAYAAVIDAAAAAADAMPLLRR